MKQSSSYIHSTRICWQSFLTEHMIFEWRFERKKERGGHTESWGRKGVPRNKSSNFEDTQVGASLPCLRKSEKPRGLSEERTDRYKGRGDRGALYLSEQVLRFLLWVKQEAEAENILIYILTESSGHCVDNKWKGPQYKQGDCQEATEKPREDVVAWASRVASGALRSGPVWVQYRREATSFANKLNTMNEGIGEVKMTPWFWPEQLEG